jgi:hypothetical protein
MALPPGKLSSLALGAHLRSAPLGKPLPLSVITLA